MTDEAVKEINSNEAFIKKIFIARIIMWIGAAVSTAIWIVYSFVLFREDLYVDEHVYATALRPVFYTCLIISIVLIITSFILRAMSDKKKARNDWLKINQW